jgi:hypothetical protein
MNNKEKYHLTKQHTMNNKEKYYLTKLAQGQQVLNSNQSFPVGDQNMTLDQGPQQELSTNPADFASLGQGAGVPPTQTQEFKKRSPGPGEFNLGGGPPLAQGAAGAAAGAAAGTATGVATDSMVSGSRNGRPAPLPGLGAAKPAWDEGLVFDEDEHAGEPGTTVSVSPEIFNAPFASPTPVSGSGGGLAGSVPLPTTNKSAPAVTSTPKEGYGINAQIRAQQ